MNILTDSVLGSNFFHNNKSGYSNKSNPCPICDNTKGKCGVGHPVVNCRTHVDGYSVGDRLNGYYFTKVSKSGDLGVWLHESEWNTNGSDRRATKKVKKATAKPKLAKWQSAKQPIKQLSQDLRSLVDQLQPTKKAVDFLNDRFSTNKTSTQWQELGYFSATGRENRLTTPVPGYIAGMKLKDPSKTSKIFNSPHGSAVNIPIYNHDGLLAGHQPKNFTGDAKYSSNCWKNSKNENVNSAHIVTPLNTVEMPLQNAIAIKEEGLDLWESEGILKPLIASEQHQINILGSMSGTPGQPWQTKQSLLALKPSRYILAVDEKTLINKNVYNRSLRTIEFISKLRDEVGLNFKIFVADWGQLLSQDGSKDIDNISTKTLKHCNLIPASVWMGFESRKRGDLTSANACPYNIYLRTGGSTPQNPPNLLSKSTFNLYTSGNTENRDFLRSLRYIDDLELAAKHHPLFSKFLAKEKLTPFECFSIAKELAWFEGGEDVYLNHLHPDFQTNDGNVNNVKSFVSVARRMGIRPDKGGLYDLLDPNSVVRLNAPETITTTEASRLLDEAFTKLLEGDATASKAIVTIVRSVTGAGKTEWLVNYLKNNRVNLVLAIANHKLKREFIERLGDDVHYLSQAELIVNPKLKQIHNQLHSIGAGEVAHKILTSLSRYKSRANLDEYVYGDKVFCNKDGEWEHFEGFEVDGLQDALDEITDEDYENIDKYLISVRNVTTANETAPRIVTHQFYRHKAAAFKDMPVISDEDLRDTFYSIKRVSVGDFTTLAKSSLNKNGLYSELAERVNALKEYQDVYVGDITEHIDTMALVKYLSRQSHLNYSVAAIANAATVVSLGAEVGIICNADPLPEQVSLNIATATPRMSFYDSRFTDKTNLLEIPEIAYKGNLIQITERSVSKSKLVANKNNVIEYIESLTEGAIKITYKDLKDTLTNCDATVHFGNAIGFDYLKGRFLAVVGTPQPSRKNILLAFVAAGNSLQGRDTNMSNQICFYNGCKFRFFAFNDPDIRNLQFEMINEQLNQAVGRARLVYFNCTVLLISNFPLAQSQILSSDEWLELKSSLQLSDPRLNGDYIHCQLAIADAKIERLEDTTDKAIQLVDRLVGDRANETIKQEGRRAAIVESFSRTNEQYRADESKAGGDDGTEDAGLCRPAIEHPYLGDGNKASEAGVIDSRIVDYLLGIIKLAIKADCANTIAGFRGHAVELEGNTIPLNKEVFKQAWKKLDLSDQPKAKKLIIQAFSEVAAR